MDNQRCEDSIEVIQLKNRIKELEATIHSMYDRISRANDVIMNCRCKTFKYYRSEANPVPTFSPNPSPEALFEKFISEENREFEYNPNYYMPILELKDMYNRWRRENGYERVAWDPKIYNMAFQEKGLYVNDTRTTLTYLGRQITGQYVYGIQPAA